MTGRRVMVLPGVIAKKYVDGCHGIATLNNI